jgi:lipopolysaccharide biosynthesis glycosyltransferase
MRNPVIFVGHDPREAVAFHVFNESLIRHASRPIRIVPLALSLLRDYTETHTDGSNAFIYSRFLVPHMMGFEGWALFCDGDMLARGDICKLWDMRDDQCAVQVVKHKYTTKHKRKYVGTSMETINPDYPRKNWSSVMLLNCSHPSNRVLTPDYVMAATGPKLHRFQHLTDDEIGELPAEWNWLVGEYPHNPDAKLAHYTLGVPAIEAYKTCDYADEWLSMQRSAVEVQL